MSNLVYEHTISIKGIVIFKCLANSKVQDKINFLNECLDKSLPQLSTVTITFESYKQLLKAIQFMLVNDINSLFVTVSRSSFPPVVYNCRAIEL